MCLRLISSLMCMEKNSFFYLYKVLLTHDLEIGYVESRGDINLGIAKCCFTRIIG